jgi:photosystem II stability/assembly factor-like uncharacterized protein
LQRTKARNDQNTLSAKEPAEIDRTAKIAEQNDHFRKTWVAYFAVPGQVFVTRGVASLSASAQVQIMRAVQTFDTFTEDNDPYRDHTFGVANAAPSQMYTGLETGLWASSDAGVNWSLVSPTTVTALAVDPQDPLHLVAARTHAVEETRDGGKTWSSLTLTQEN